MSFPLALIPYDVRELIWSFLPRATRPYNREDREVQGAFFSTQLNLFSTCPADTLIGRLIDNDPELKPHQRLWYNRFVDVHLKTTHPLQARLLVERIEKQAMDRIDWIRSQIDLDCLQIHEYEPTKTLSFKDWNRIDRHFELHTAKFCRISQQFLTHIRRSHLDPHILGPLLEVFSMAQSEDLSAQECCQKIKNSLLGNQPLSEEEELIHGFEGLEGGQNTGPELLNQTEPALFILQEKPELIAEILSDARFSSNFLFGLSVAYELHSAAALILNGCKKLQPILLSAALSECIEKSEFHLGICILNALKKIQGPQGFFLSVALSECIDLANLRFGILIIKYLKETESYQKYLFTALEKCIQNQNESFAEIINKELALMNLPQ